MATHKILVIDDSRVIRMRVKEMLPPGNFEVLEAGNGVEGLDLIQQANPNLIMLDFLLPRLSGWEVFQHIQNHPTLRSIPLVLMSGRKEEVTEKITEPFEHFAFVEKPFEKQQLIAAIKEAMGKAARRPATPLPATPKPEPAPVSPPVPTTETSSASAAEIQALTEQVAKMQGEIDNLKKQLSQLAAFIKQKLK